MVNFKVKGLGLNFFSIFLNTLLSEFFFFQICRFLNFRVKKGYKGLKIVHFHFLEPFTV